jgi:hypothetical protein
MFRNEEELINSLFHKLNGKNESRPAPLTSKELNEIEEYRDNDGFIDLTHVKSFTELQRLIELVDRKNHLEELDSQETTSLQDTVTDLIAELLPIIGVDKANLKLNTPEGKATVEVVKGEKPKVVYEYNPVREPRTIVKAKSIEDINLADVEDTEMVNL